MSQIFKLFLDHTSSYSVQTERYIWASAVIKNPMMSPKVLEGDGLVIWFHSYDALHENRASIHIGKGSQDDHNDAKIWLEPKIEIAPVGKILKTRDLNKGLKMIEKDLDYLLNEWHSYRSKANG